MAVLARFWAWFSRSFLLQMISTGFNLLGFSPHLTQAIWGAT